MADNIPTPSGERDIPSIAGRATTGLRSAPIDIQSTPFEELRGLSNTVGNLVGPIVQRAEKQQLENLSILDDKLKSYLQISGTKYEQAIYASKGEATQQAYNDMIAGHNQIYDQVKGWLNGNDTIDFGYLGKITRKNMTSKQKEALLANVEGYLAQRQNAFNSKLGESRLEVKGTAIADNANRMIVGIQEGTQSLGSALQTNEEFIKTLNLGHDMASAAIEKQRIRMVYSFIETMKESRAVDLEQMLDGKIPIPGSTSTLKEVLGADWADIRSKYEKEIKESAITQVSKDLEANWKDFDNTPDKLNSINEMIKNISTFSPDWENLDKDQKSEVLRYLNDQKTLLENVQKDEVVLGASEAASGYFQRLIQYQTDGGAENSPVNILREASSDKRLLGSDPAVVATMRAVQDEATTQMRLEKAEKRAVRSDALQANYVAQNTYDVAIYEAMQLSGPDRVNELKRLKGIIIRDEDLTKSRTTLLNKIDKALKAPKTPVLDSVMKEFKRQRSIFFEDVSTDSNGNLAPDDDEEYQLMIDGMAKTAKIEDELTQAVADNPQITYEELYKKFGDLMKGQYEEINQGFFKKLWNNWFGVEAPSAKTTTKPAEGGTPRDRAIAELRRRNKVVNEDTIKTVINRMQEAE